MAADAVTSSGPTTQETAEVLKDGMAEIQLPVVAVGTVAAVLTASKGPAALGSGTAVAGWATFLLADGTTAYFPYWVHA